MTQNPPAWRRAPDLFLVAAMLLLTGAGMGQLLLDRERSFEAGHDGLAGVANAAEATARTNLSAAMRLLDSVAATFASHPAEQAGLPETLRLVVAGVTGAVSAIMFDDAGQMLASAGLGTGLRGRDQTHEQARSQASEVVAEMLADPSGPPWRFAGRDLLVMARRVMTPGGGLCGVAVLAIGAGWMQRLGAGGYSEAISFILTDADGNVILRSPAAPPAGPPAARPATITAASDLGGAAAPARPDLAGQLVVIRAVLPGQLALVAARDEEIVLRPWRQRSAMTLAVLTAVLTLLVAGWLRVRSRIERLQAANLRHVRQLAQLATASERLSRLRDVDEIVARAEAIGRALLGSERVEVMLGPPPAANDMVMTSFRHGISLLGASGERLGRITLTRATAGFTSDDDLVLEQFARAVASALEGATLLADTMRSKSELELILSTISDGMFVLDRSWCIRYANAAAARYLQHRREGMLGVQLWTLLPGLRGGEMGERLEEAAGQTHDAAFTSFYPPLNAWFEMRTYPFAGGLTVYFRDVTVQRETEEKLRQAQKLEAVGQLTGGIAHDVNNLLTVILGNLELLAMRAEDRLNAASGLDENNGDRPGEASWDRPDGRPADRRGLGAGPPVQPAPQFGETMPGGEEDSEEERGLDLALAEAGLRAGESASQLMHRLLAFSRRQPLSPKVVAVGDLLQSLQPLMRRTMSEQLSLRMHWTADLWHALVDPAELESAVLNLSINAQDAMPGGGTLAIEATNIAIDRVYASVAGLDRTGDYVMISVSDNGTGMPKDVRARAFDPFFTTKAPGKGTGLGLSMVYAFVHQSGGHVLIDSEPGRGTMVRMYLPRTLAAGTVARAPSRPGVAGGNETILLVEDNDLVRAHTETMLRGLGYQVVSAADGTSAVRAVAVGLRPDLLLTDVILPGGMTGRDVAEEVQSRLPGLRVLFISGYSGNVLMENGRLPPGVDLLGKPFRRSELAARIRGQLGGRCGDVSDGEAVPGKPVSGKPVSGKPVSGKPVSGKPLSGKQGAARPGAARQGAGAATIVAGADGGPAGPTATPG